MDGHSGCLISLVITRFSVLIWRMNTKYHQNWADKHLNKAANKAVFVWKIWGVQDFGITRADRLCQAQRKRSESSCRSCCCSVWTQRWVQPWIAIALLQLVSRCRTAVTLWTIMNFEFWYWIVLVAVYARSQSPQICSDSLKRDECHIEHVQPRELPVLG